MRVCVYMCLYMCMMMCVRCAHVNGSLLESVRSCIAHQPVRYTLVLHHCSFVFRIIVLRETGVQLAIEAPRHEILVSL